MTTIQFAQALARWTTARDFAALAADDAVLLLHAANAAFQEARLARSPGASAKVDYGEWMDGVQVLSMDVVRGQKRFTWADADATVVEIVDRRLGQTVDIDGEAGFNRVNGDAELLYPYGGTSGTKSCLIYSDAIHLPDRIGPVFSVELMDGNTVWELQPLPEPERSRVTIEEPGCARFFVVENFGTPRGASPARVLRVHPRQSTAMRVRVWHDLPPFTLTLDTMATARPLPFVEACQPWLLEVAVGYLVGLPFFAGDARLAVGRQEAARQMLAMQPQYDAPLNFVGTPSNW